MPRLRVNEIFYSLQGESLTTGRPTSFVRLTGCPLRCSYCDTDYAFDQGEWMELEQIEEKIRAFKTNLITLTGGEPLAQKNSLELMTRLCNSGYLVSLETSGALDISQVDPRVSTVLDIKTPGSGEVERNLWSNLESLDKNDQIKFVISSKIDYQWSVERLAEYALPKKCEVLFSPAFGLQDATELAERVLADNLDVRVQIQLHKILWGNERGK